MTICTESLFQWIDAQREAMIDLWRESVLLESGPGNKQGVDQVAEKFAAVLRAMGADTKELTCDEAGNMLIATLGEQAASPILFIGHMDTACAEGEAVQRPFIMKDGKVYGPGVLDMKGGIVAFLYAMKALSAAGYNKRPLKVILVGDEEVLHAKSEAPELIMAEASGALAAFNCETGFMDDGIVVGRKGVARIMMETKGVAAHAGNDPENGRSAILELAHKVIAIQDQTAWERETTYNVGVIEGGTTSTTVPERAKLFIDVRYSDPEMLPSILLRLENIASDVKVAGTVTTVTLLEGIKPMKTTAAVMQLFELVKEVSAENKFPLPYAKKVGGASDSAYAVLADVPTVCAMGVKGGRNHSPEEFAVIDTLFERAKLLAAMVLKLD